MSTKSLLPDDDPAVIKAMAMYDNDLDETERRNVFRTMIEAVVAAKRANYTGTYLSDFAESMTMTVRMNSIPGYRDAIRAARNRSTTGLGPDDGVSLDEATASLRGEGGDPR